MARFLLKIAYDGTAYHGWQVQNNAVTVQEVLGNGLTKIIKENTGVTGCSRTDAGVHANEFFCHFDCYRNIPEVAFVKGLNSILPNDIVVLECKTVDEDFHARYSSKGKNYIYKFYDSEQRNPFLNNRALYVPQKLNVDRINTFCKNLIGEYDFIGFSSSGRTVTDTVRTIYDCNAIRNNDEVVLSITGNGFLYNMVRIIAGTAIDVSDGKIDPNDTVRLIKAKDRSLLGPTVSPYGLYLNKVFY